MLFQEGYFFPQIFWQICYELEDYPRLVVNTVSNQPDLPELIRSNEDHKLGYTMHLK